MAQRQLQVDSGYEPFTWHAQLPRQRNFRQPLFQLTFLWPFPFSFRFWLIKVTWPGCKYAALSAASPVQRSASAFSRIKCSPTSRAPLHPPHQPQRTQSKPILFMVSSFRWPLKETQCMVHAQTTSQAPIRPIIMRQNQACASISPHTLRPRLTCSKQSFSMGT